VALAWTAPHRRRALAAVSAWAALFVILVAALPSPLEASLARRHGRQDRVLWHEEGVQTTVSVHLQAPRRHVLYLDGLHQSDDSPEMLRTHREIGHLPMILHRAPRRALVVGLGGGATAGAVSQHAAQVQVVELSDSVRKGAAFFAHANYDVLRRANVRLRVDDGRNYLQSTTARYDVITADIIQPGHAGAGLVYSVEYYRLARRALARDGLMLQWVGHRTETEYRLLVRTFLEVFPHATLWMDGTLLVGGAGPLALSRSAFEAQRAHPETRQALDAIGLDSFEALLARFRAGAPSLARVIGRGEILSDDRPRLEYNRSIPRGERAVDFASLPRNLAELRIED
jgi:spermidine synthase